MMKSIALLIFLGFLSSCNQTKTENAMVEVASGPVIDSTTFIHTVFFWIKPNADSTLLADFPDGLDELGKVPVILKYYKGVPANTPREVVDNSYGFGWVVHFKSAADQDTYQTHPIHLAFIEKYKSLWDSVKVYDTVIQ